MSSIFKIYPKLKISKFKIFPKLKIPKFNTMKAKKSGTRREI